jgi:hypothetical protein
MNKAEKIRQQEESAEALSKLREMYPPGSYVTTLLRHVSASGMTRAISVVRNGERGPEDISWLLARAVPGWKINSTHGGLTRGGCGMDMGFDLAYSLSRRLYPDGFGCIQYTPEGADLYEASGRNERRYCPSNDHSNGLRAWARHSDGGYALRHVWL